MSDGFDDAGLGPGQRALVEKWLDDPDQLSAEECDRLQSSPAAMQLAQELRDVRGELDRAGEAMRQSILAEANRGRGYLRPLLVALAAAAAVVAWLVIDLGGGEARPDDAPPFMLSDDLGLSYRAEAEGLHLRWTREPAAGSRLRVLVLAADGTELRRIDEEEAGTSYLLDPRGIEGRGASFLVRVEVIVGGRATQAGTIAVRWP